MNERNERDRDMEISNETGSETTTRERSERGEISGSDQQLLDDTEMRDEDLVESDTGEIDVDDTQEHSRSRTGAGE
jgi:hypothetical protein